MVKNLPGMCETSVGKIPWRRKRQPTPAFLSAESHGQGNLAAYGPWGHKESMERLPLSFIRWFFPGASLSEVLHFCAIAVGQSSGTTWEVNEGGEYYSSRGTQFTQPFLSSVAFLP